MRGVADEEARAPKRRQALDEAPSLALVAGEIQEVRLDVADRRVEARVLAFGGGDLGDQSRHALGLARIERSTSRHMTLPEPSQMPLSGASR